MTTAQLPKVNSDSGGFDDIKGLTDILNSMFGGATTSTGKSESPDSASMGQADALLKKIMGDSNPGDIDAMVGNILDRAKQSFGPAAISANAAGVRAYSDSSLASMRNEAMARATGEAAAAKLNAINAANNQATQLVTAKLKSSTASTQKQKTSGSPGGQAIGIAALGMQGYNLLKKKGVIDKVTAGMTGTPDATVGDFTGGGGGGFEGVDFSSDAAFSSPASDTSSTGIDGLLDFAKTPPVDAPVEAAATPSGDAPVAPEGTGVAADAVAAPVAGEVVTGGYAMPPAQTIDPITGMPNSMPAANAISAFDTANEAEAIDAIPADEGANAADLSSSVDLGDAAFDPGMEAVGSAAGETIGDYYFPGAFTVANLATEGQLGEATGEVVGTGLDMVGGTLGTAGALIGATGDNIGDLADSIFGGDSFNAQELLSSLFGI